MNIKQPKLSLPIYNLSPGLLRKLSNKHFTDKIILYEYINNYELSEPIRILEENGVKYLLINKQNKFQKTIDTYDIYINLLTKEYKSLWKWIHVATLMINNKSEWIILNDLKNELQSTHELLMTLFNNQNS